MARSAVRWFARSVARAPDPLPLQGDGDPFRAEPPLELALAAERLRVLAPAG